MWTLLHLLDLRTKKSLSKQTEFLSAPVWRAENPWNRSMRVPSITNYFQERTRRDGKPKHQSEFPDDIYTWLRFNGLYLSKDVR